MKRRERDVIEYCIAEFQVHVIYPQCVALQALLAKNAWDDGMQYDPKKATMGASRCTKREYKEIKDWARTFSKSLHIELEPSGTTENTASSCEVWVRRSPGQTAVQISQLGNKPSSPTESEGIGWSGGYSNKDNQSLNCKECCSATVGRTAPEGPGGAGKSDWWYWWMSNRYEEDYLGSNCRVYSHFNDKVFATINELQTWISRYCSMRFCCSPKPLQNLSYPRIYKARHVHDVVSFFYWGWIEKYQWCIRTTALENENLTSTDAESKNAGESSIAFNVFKAYILNMEDLRIRI